DNTFGKVINRLIELGIFKDKNVPEKWVNVFCNYWIADKKTWDRYIKILNEVLRLFQQDTILVDILKDNNFSYRGKNYSNIPFALEYSFGLFLADNPDILWKEIPVKLLYAQPLNIMPSVNYQSNKNFRDQSLSDIYQRYQAPAGWGDKGTLHHYIQNYDELFTP